MVRLIGLEPTRRKTPDPKSGASTNFATGAFCGCKGSYIFSFCKIISDEVLGIRRNFKNG